RRVGRADVPRDRLRGDPAVPAVTDDREQERGHGVGCGPEAHPGELAAVGSHDATCVARIGTEILDARGHETAGVGSRRGRGRPPRGGGARRPAPRAPPSTPARPRPVSGPPHPPARGGGARPTGPPKRPPPGPPGVPVRTATASASQRGSSIPGEDRGPGPAV